MNPSNNLFALGQIPTNPQLATQSPQPAPKQQTVTAEVTMIGGIPVFNPNLFTQQANTHPDFNKFQF